MQVVGAGLPAKRSAIQHGERCLSVNGLKIMGCPHAIENTFRLGPADEIGMWSCGSKALVVGRCHNVPGSKKVSQSMEGPKGCTSLDRGRAVGSHAHSAVCKCDYTVRA